ncbi:MAG: proliferating cell nuclear antigen (pcna) [Magnetococcales bacterium]|nr:proliferating cell nuclear antigen (pcna) [Magnetococcales bacterium]|tara:strand:+ start:21403 stop:22386 length:984 start_codon:yes stop_codon:yes gene_type:complete
MNILNVKTEHTAPMKILFEVLKELLQEANIEFRYDKSAKLKNDKNDSDDSDDDNSQVSDSDDSDDENNQDNKSKKWSGMKIMAVDSTKTILIHLKLQADKFREFECKKQKMIIGVNFTHFHKLIKSMDKDDNLTLYMEKDNENYLGIKVDNPEKKKVDFFKMKLMDLDTDPFEIPPTEFDAVVTMPSSEFHKICREMYSIAEFVDIKCIKNKVVFTCKGDYAERSTTYVENKNGVNIHHATKEDNDPQIVHGIYDLKSLVLFSKCQSLCNDIRIYMKNSYPLVIRYTVATLGDLLVCITPVHLDSKDDDFSDDDEYYDDDEIELNYK